MDSPKNDNMDREKLKKYRQSLNKRKVIKRRQTIAKGKMYLVILAAIFVIGMTILIWDRTHDLTDAVASSTDGFKLPSFSDSKKGPEVPLKPIVTTTEPWMVLLVNDNHPMQEGYIPTLGEIRNGMQVDVRCVEQLNAMIEAAQAEGLKPIVCSAYRSEEKQKELFNAQVEMHVESGLSREQAVIEAKKAVAYPGTSEHGLGMAVDIVSSSYQLLDEEQLNTDETKWLIAHCSEYGFILRYPTDKIDKTGVFFEPWHYRYVGLEAATQIMSMGLCLEEYTEYFEN